MSVNSPRLFTALTLPTVVCINFHAIRRNPPCSRQNRRVPEKPLIAKFLRLLTWHRGTWRPRAHAHTRPPSPPPSPPPRKKFPLTRACGATGPASSPKLMRDSSAGALHVRYARMFQPVCVYSDLEVTSSHSAVINRRLGVDSSKPAPAATEQERRVPIKWGLYGVFVATTAYAPPLRLFLSHVSVSLYLSGCGHGRARFLQRAESILAKLSSRG